MVQVLHTRIVTLLGPAAAGAVPLGGQEEELETGDETNQRNRQRQKCTRRRRAAVTALEFGETQWHHRERQRIDPNSHLTPGQVRHMSAAPDALFRYLEFLRPRLQTIHARACAANVEQNAVRNTVGVVEGTRKGGAETEGRPWLSADIWVQINGPPFQRFINPLANLADAPYAGHGGVGAWTRRRIAAYRSRAWWRRMVEVEVDMRRRLPGGAGTVVFMAETTGCMDADGGRREREGGTEEGAQEEAEGEGAGAGGGGRRGGGGYEDGRGGSGGAKGIRRRRTRLAEGCGLDLQHEVARLAGGENEPGEGGGGAGGGEHGGNSRQRGDRRGYSGEDVEEGRDDDGKAEGTGPARSSPIIVVLDGTLVVTMGALGGTGDGTGGYDGRREGRDDGSIVTEFVLRADSAEDGLDELVVAPYTQHIISFERNAGSALWAYVLPPGHVLR
jgi:hypothetical protein